MKLLVLKVVDILRLKVQIYKDKPVRQVLKPR